MPLESLQPEKRPNILLIDSDPIEKDGEPFDPRDFIDQEYIDQAKEILETPTGMFTENQYYEHSEIAINFRQLFPNEETSLHFTDKVSEKWEKRAKRENSLPGNWENSFKYIRGLKMFYPDKYQKLPEIALHEKAINSELAHWIKNNNWQKFASTLAEMKIACPQFFKNFHEIAEYYWDNIKKQFQKELKEGDAWAILSLARSIRIILPEKLSKIEEKISPQIKKIPKDIEHILGPRRLKDLYNLVENIAVLSALDLEYTSRGLKLIHKNKESDSTTPLPQQKYY